MEITNKDIGYIFQVAILSNDNLPLTKLIGIVDKKHLILGREVLDFIKSKW